MSEMKLSEFQKERTRIISEMLDNPGKYEMYPTTKAFEEFDNLFLALEKKVKELQGIIKTQDHRIESVKHHLRHSNANTIRTLVKGAEINLLIHDGNPDLLLKPKQEAGK